MDTQQRGLDLVQTPPVASDPDRHIVVEERLRQAHDGVCERTRIRGRLIRARRHLRLDQRLDAGDCPRLHAATARSQQPQRPIAFLLQQRAERIRAREAAVHAVEHLEQPVGASALDVRAVTRDQLLEFGGDDLAKQLVTRPEPPIDRRSSQS
jgi:hypothetical protein